MSALPLGSGPTQASRQVAVGPKPAVSNRSKAASLLNHLVGGREQGRRHGEAEHPGGFGIDDQLKLACLHDRQLRRLRALEDATSIDAKLTPRACKIASVT